MSANDATVRFGYDGTQLNRGLSDMDKRMRKSARNTETSFSRMRGAIATLGLGLLVRQSVGVVASMDRMRRGMTTLEGSAEAATLRLDELREASKLPGVGFEQATAADIKLRSVGVSAELSKKSIIEMGNALALSGGTASDLDGVILALTQIISKGKVSAEEINQIAERVPQVRKVMQDAFGTADTEKLQKMNISSEEFVTKLIGGFGELQRATAGLDEKMQDFRTSINLATEAFMSGLVNQGVEGASKLGAALDANNSRLRALGQASSDFAAAAGDAFFTIADLASSASTHIGLMLEGNSLEQANRLISQVEQSYRDEAAAAAEAAKQAKTGGDATVAAETKKQTAIDATARKRREEMQLSRDTVMADLEVLKLRAHGHERQAKALERKMQIEREAARIIRETGASPEQARKIATQKAKLEDRMNGVRHIGGVGGKRLMTSGLDQFERNQLHDETALGSKARPGYASGDFVPRHNAFDIAPTSAQQTGRMMGGADGGSLADRRGAASSPAANDAAAAARGIMSATPAINIEGLGKKLDETNALLKEGLDIR